MGMTALNPPHSRTKSNPKSNLGNYNYRSRSRSSSRRRGNNNNNNGGRNTNTSNASNNNNNYNNNNNNNNNNMYNLQQDSNYDIEQFRGEGVVSLNAPLEPFESYRQQDYSYED